jgi:hypothetical protein
MKERDDELDKILKPLLNLKPTEAQTKRWKSVTKLLSKPSYRRFGQRLIPLATAAAIGFLIGAAVFKTNEAPLIPPMNKNFDAYATIETVYVKNE